jgi:hypothetical protein
MIADKPEEKDAGGWNAWWYAWWNGRHGWNGWNGNVKPFSYTHDNLKTPEKLKLSF